MTLLEFGEFSSYAVDVSEGNPSMPFELMTDEEQRRAWREAASGS